MRPTRLDVRLHGRLVGALDDHGSGTYTFSYTDDVERTNQLSASLPVSQRAFLSSQTKPFFEGLLPEERVRVDLARQLGIDPSDSFLLLAAIGRECAGAVVICPTGEVPETSETVMWLNDAELIERIEQLPSFPLGRDETTRSRASLAGAQRKMVAVVEGQRVGIAQGTTPTTHVLKPEWRPGPDDPQIVDIVANEAYCMRLATAAGCEVASVEPRRIGNRPVLFVERFDRSRTPEGRLVRLHQEDIAQAAGKLPASKYEQDGGIGFAEVGAVARGAGVAAISAARALLDAIVVAAAIGNADQHAKNLAILYGPTVKLAPLYDLTSTVVYDDLSRRSAFVIGGELYIDEVGADACVEAARSVGMPERQARRHVEELTARLHDAADAVRDRSVADGWHAPVVDRIRDLVVGWPARAAVTG